MFTELASRQELIAEFFRKSLEKSHLARAYLLTGQAKQDKFEFIKELNQILNCQLNYGLLEAKAAASYFNTKQKDCTSPLLAGLDSDSLGSAKPKQKFSYRDACGQCQNCKWIAEDEHPKTPIVLDSRESIKKNIKVEKIRELQTELSQKSEFSRIIIIDDASSSVLNRFSATSLLKTIEEAKPNNIFILLADSKDSVLSTIRSRSQILNFNSTEKTEFSENVNVLVEELEHSINSGHLNSRLEQLIRSESLAKYDNNEIVETLMLMQNEISERISADFDKQSSLILAIDKAIRDIRSFVRPKAVLGQLLKEL